MWWLKFYILEWNRVKKENKPKKCKVLKFCFPNGHFLAILVHSLYCNLFASGRFRKYLGFWQYTRRVSKRETPQNYFQLVFKLSVGDEGIGKVWSLLTSVRFISISEEEGTLNTKGLWYLWDLPIFWKLWIIWNLSL